MLLTPTSPTVAFPIGDKTDNPLAMYLCDTYTIPTNLSGDPGMSVPFGTGAGGLPVGVQVSPPRSASRRCSASPRPSRTRPRRDTPFIRWHHEEIFVNRRDAVLPTAIQGVNDRLDRTNTRIDTIIDVLAHLRADLQSHTQQPLP